MRQKCFLFLVLVVISFGDFDPWAALGVPKGSAPDVVKRAYRRASLAVHPDRNPGPEAAARFAEVARAYEILSDDVSRASFDTMKFQSGDQYFAWKAEQERLGKVVATDAAGFFPADGAVLALTPDSFAAMVQKLRDVGTASAPRPSAVIIMWYATWCLHCQQFAPEYRRAALELEAEADAAPVPASSSSEVFGPPVIAAVNCAAFSPLCQAEQIPAYPTLRALLPSPGGGFAVEQYSAPLQSAEGIRSWLKELTSPDQAVRLGSWADLETSVLSSPTPWLVLLSMRGCGPCQGPKSQLRGIAGRLPSVGVAVVECDESSAAADLCARLGARHYPWIKVFPRGAAAKRARFGGVGADVLPDPAHQHHPAMAQLDVVAQVMDALLPPGQPHKADGGSTQHQQQHGEEL